MSATSMAALPMARKLSAPTTRDHRQSNLQRQRCQQRRCNVGVELVLLHQHQCCACVVGNSNFLSITTRLLLQPHRRQRQRRSADHRQFSCNNSDSSSAMRNIGRAAANLWALMTTTMQWRQPLAEQQHATSACASSSTASTTEPSRRQSTAPHATTAAPATRQHKLEQQCCRQTVAASSSSLRCSFSINIICTASYQHYLRINCSLVSTAPQQ